MQRILGIDCSSTTIGYSILDIDDGNNITLIHAGFIKPAKKGSLIYRLSNTRDELKSIIDYYKPTDVVIEDIISYMQHKSTAKTIIMLATFNRMACLLANDLLQKEPYLYNVMSIRHGIKIKDFPKKEDIPELVAKRLNIQFPYLYKKNKIIKENYDVADSVAVGLYHALQLTNQIKKKK